MDYKTDELPPWGISGSLLFDQLEFFLGSVGKKGGDEADDRLVTRSPESPFPQFIPLDNNKLCGPCAINAQAGTPFAGTVNRRKTDLLIRE